MQNIHLINWLKTYWKFGFRLNQIFNRINYLFSHKGEFLRYRPLWLLIYVSDICNLQCRMCPHHTTGDSSSFKFLKQEKGIMTPGTFKKILNKFPESTLVMFAGVGEPLLNPYFLKLAEMAAREQKIINLVTNGTLLKENIVNKIIENGRFNQVSISLNASTTEDYKSICNMPASTFRKVVENIKNLVKAKVKNSHKAKFDIVVSAVYSNQFIKKAQDFLLFTDSLGVDKIDIHNYIDFSIIEKSEQGKPIIFETKVEREIQRLEIFAERNIRAKVNLPIICKKDNFRKKCEWFFKNLSLDAYGNIGSCGRVMNPQHSYGNIFNSAEDTWNNQYMRCMRKKILTNRNKLPECCFKCIENY